MNQSAVADMQYLTQSLRNAWDIRSRDYFESCLALLMKRAMVTDVLLEQISCQEAQKKDPGQQTPEKPT